MSGPTQRIKTTILDQIAELGCSPTMMELADRVRMPVGTVHRFCKIMEKDGVLERVGNARSGRLRVREASRAGLTVAQLAWCQANPARVQAMMDIAGARS